MQFASVFFPSLRGILSHMSFRNMCLKFSVHVKFTALTVSVFKKELRSGSHLCSLNWVYTGNHMARDI